MKYKIGAYVRISTEEAAQIQEGSISSQKHRIQSWIELKNIQQDNWGKVIEVYSDEGISAKDMNRPAFQKMMSDLISGKINLILVTELSRLSRSISDFCHILEELKTHKASFLSIKEQFDTSTPAGEMMVFNMINLAQFERKQVAERVSLNFHSRALRGLINGGQPPLGYDKDPEKRCTYIINETEAPVVREIFQTYLIEGSLSKTMKKLNELGIQPKQRNKKSQWQSWNVKNINQLLRNLSYIGKKEVNAKYRNEDQSGLKAFQKYSVVPASWKPIVEENIFNEVQLRLTEAAKNERDRLSKGVFNTYWLSGIIKCMDCGKKFVGSCSHGKNEVHRYYLHPGTSKEMSTCTFKRIRADEVEQKIESHLVEILQINGHFDHLQKNIEMSYKSNATDSLSEQSQLKKKQAQLSEDLEKLFELQMSSKGLAREIFDERIEKIAIDRKRIQSRLAELEQKELVAREYDNAAERIKNHVLEFSRGWKKATGAERKRLARKVLSRLIPTESGVEVYYFMGKEKSNEAGGSGEGLSVEGQKLKNQVLSLVSEGSDIVKVGCPKATTRNNGTPVDFIEFFQKRSTQLLDIVGPLYRQGLSISDIEAQTGLKRHSIWKCLRKHRQELRPQNPVPFERWRQGHGKMSARPPFGFCYFQGQVIKDPKEYPTLQLIQSLWKQGTSIGSIMRKLDGRGIKTRMKKPWSYNVVKSIIGRLQEGTMEHLASSHKPKNSKTNSTEVKNESR